MREIKFRAWNVDKRKMHLLNEDDWDVTRRYGGFPRQEVMGYEKPKNNEEAGRLELMQSTGLKDKNGKEIYEGDILRIFDKNYEVKIIQTESRMFVNYGYPDKHNGPAPDWVEVIGNIYENPELLKGA